MKVKVAETAGFCFGVKRAVDKVYQLIEDGVSPIYTLGPIIHNEEVVSDLESRGVRVIEVEDLDHIKSGTVVIRSHGVGREIYEKLKENGLEYVDVTCPFCISRSTGSSRKKALLGNRSSFSEIRSIRRCRGSAAGAMARTESSKTEKMSRI